MYRVEYYRGGKLLATDDRITLPMPGECIAMQSFSGPRHLYRVLSLEESRCNLQREAVGAPLLCSVQVEPWEKVPEPEIETAGLVGVAATGSPRPPGREALVAAVGLLKIASLGLLSPRPIPDDVAKRYEAVAAYLDALAGNRQ